jgi:hypothetical protein
MFPTEPRLLQQQYGFGDLRIASVPLNVPVRTGWEWISLDVSGLRSGKNLNPDNDLRRSLAFGGSPWKVEVERVKGIEPSYAAWEAAVLPLNYTRMDNRAATPFGRQHTPSPVQITT